MKGVKGELFKDPMLPEFEFECGMLFKDVKHFRKVLKDNQTIEDYEILRTYNEKERITIMCGSVKCEWRIHASKLPDLRTFVMKKIGKPHLCLRDPEKAHVTPKWIANVLKEEFKTQPDLPCTKVEETLRKKFGVEANYACIYKEKR